MNTIEIRSITHDEAMHYIEKEKAQQFESAWFYEGTKTRTHKERPIGHEFMPKQLKYYITEKGIYLQ